MWFDGFDDRLTQNGWSQTWFLNNPPSPKNDPIHEILKIFIYPFFVKLQFFRQTSRGPPLTMGIFHQSHCTWILFSYWERWYNNFSKLQAFRNFRNQVWNQPIVIFWTNVNWKKVEVRIRQRSWCHFNDSIWRLLVGSHSWSRFRNWPKDLLHCS